MDPRRPRASWVAVQGERILALGEGQGFRSWVGTNTRLVDLAGRLLLPGINDAHCHLFATLAQWQSVDCRPEAAPSIAALGEALRRQAADLPAGTWVRGVGYHEALLRERRHPSRWDLDSVISRHPVLLHHQSHHAVVLNSLGLRLAGVGLRSPDPPGGWWERDRAGEPTGLGYHVTPWLTERVLPPPSAEETAAALAAADRQLRSLGVTCLQEATATNDLQRWETLRRWKEQGKLTPRVRMLVAAERASEFRLAQLSYRAGTADLRVGPAKITLDETAESFIPSLERFRATALEAVAAAFPLAIHAVEESALVAASQLLRDLKGRAGPALRHRLEHAALVPPWLLALLREVRPLVVTHPAFVHWHGDRYRSEIAPSQQSWLYRLRAFRAAGLGPAIGSDSPVAPWDPWPALYAAVTRRTRTGQPVSPQEALPLRQALAGFTRWAAHAAGDEAELGTLSIGKLADLVLLDRDPQAYHEGAELLELRPTMTVVGGRIVWESEDPR